MTFEEFSSFDKAEIVVGAVVLLDWSMYFKWGIKAAQIAWRAGSLVSFDSNPEMVSMTMLELLSDAGTTLTIWKIATRCSALAVLPVFGRAKTSVTIALRVVSSEHFEMIAWKHSTDFERVSALEDLDADRIDPRSFPGRSDEMSNDMPVTSSAKTTETVVSLGSRNPD